MWELQVTEEVAAHLKEGGVVVKPYDAMLDDVRQLASSGQKLWADPAKVSSGGLQAVCTPFRLAQCLTCAELMHCLQARLVVCSQASGHAHTSTSCK